MRNTIITALVLFSTTQVFAQGDYTRPAHYSVPKGTKTLTLKTNDSTVLTWLKGRLFNEGYMVKVDGDLLSTDLLMINNANKYGFIAQLVKVDSIYELRIKCRIDASLVAGAYQIGLVGNTTNSQIIYTSESKCSGPNLKVWEYLFLVLGDKMVNYTFDGTGKPCDMYAQK